MLNLETEDKALAGKCSNPLSSRSSSTSLQSQQLQCGFGKDPVALGKEGSHCIWEGRIPLHLGRRDPSPCLHAQQSSDTTCGQAQLHSAACQLLLESFSMEKNYDFSSNSHSDPQSPVKMSFTVY